MRISDWSSDVCSSDLVAPYLGRCVTVDDIERLLGEVTKAYIDRGYATTRAYLPEQDLSSGRLRIEVVEGRISRIEVDGSGVFVPGAFLYPDGDRLNLRRLEQGLDQINRLRSEEHTSELQSLMRISYAVFCLKKKKNK